MDAKEMAARFPELGTEQEIAASLQNLASIPKLNLYLRKITCGSVGFGNEEGDQGHILIQSLSDENVVGSPIGVIDLDAKSCEALLRALIKMRAQLKALAAYRENPQN